MDHICNLLIDNLNHENVDIRLDSLAQLIKLVESKDISMPVKGTDVNNHIHTTYSFSPYSPTKAIWMAYLAGLATAGIMDHDSIGGAEEFRKAGKIAGIETTTGIECRVDMSRTPLFGKRINNPDQKSIAYMALHGIPSSQIYTIRDFFLPYTLERNKRNRAMVDKLNDYFSPYDIYLDFEKDIIPLSMSQEGGSITERHLLYALSLRLIETFGKGKGLIDFLTEKLSLNLNDKSRMFLSDLNNTFYAYDLLGILKSDLIGVFYINATEECPSVDKVLELSRKTGCISAYAYLGDVVNSVTGDKKAQKFEDDYIEQLFEYLDEAGFNAVTYMPSRNTRDQLIKVRSLCDKFNLFEISGEDINSPRQSFICEAMRDDFFKPLINATWALIGHEKQASLDLDKSMFSEAIAHQFPKLAQRISYYIKST